MTWLGTLLVTTATSSSATTLEAGATPTVDGPSTGTSATPQFTVTNTTTDAIECTFTAGTTAPAENDPGWASCAAAGSGTYQPALGGDGTYGIWARSVRQVDVPTTVPVPTTTDVPDPNNPDTSTVTMTPSPTTVPSPTTSPATGYSPLGSKTYVRDTAGPTFSASGPSGDGNDDTPSWTVTAGGGEAVTCTLYDDATPTANVVVPAGACTGFGPVAALAEGTYTLTATATDALGNASTTDVATYRLDTTLPDVTLGPASQVSPDGTVTWTLGGADAATASCRLTAPAAGSFPAFDSGVQQPCAGLLTDPLPHLGTYTLTATATDAATNTTTRTAVAFFREAPAATVTASASTGQSTSVSWTISADPLSGLTCSLSGPGQTTSYTADPGCANGGTVVSTLTGTDGPYTFTVVATDPDTSYQTTATADYALDRVAPGVTVTPLADNSTTASAGWTVAVSGGGGTPTCTLQNSAGTPLGTGTGCAQFATFTLPAQDTYTFTATSKDLADNSTTATDTWIYRSAPTAAVTTPQPTGSSASVGFHVTATNGTDLACTLTAPGGSSQVIGCVNGSTPVVNVGAEQGTWVFDVLATDPATGFTGTASATYVFDDIAPAAFTVGGTSGDQKTRAVSWSWTPPEGGLTQSCRLLLAGADYGTATACTSPYTTPVPSDGAWRLRVTLTDAAGNSTSATGPEDRVDTVVPAAPGVTTPKTLSNDTAPVWTITGEATSVFTCSWTANVAVTLPASGTCTDGYAPTLPSTSGVYTLHVTQTDPALNVSPERTFAYTLDVIAPVVTFSAEPASPAVDTTPTWTTTVSESTVKTECRLVRTGDGAVIHDWQTTGCGRTVTEALPADGTYVLSVRDTDAAGNLSAAGTSSAPYALDTTGPGTPTVDGPFGWGAEKNVTWTITAPSGEAPAGYRCRLVKDGNPGGWSACDTMSYSTTLNAQATYRLDVESLDALGNPSNPTTSSADYMYDPNPPSAATFTGTAGTGNVPSRTWTWTPGEPNLTATCQLYTVDGTRTAVGTSSACASPKTVALASPTTGTTYVLEVTLTDRAGNFTRADGPSYRLDTVAPVAPTVDGPSGTNSTRAAAYTFVASESGTTATCDLMQRPLNSTTWTSVQTTTSCPATWNVTLPSVDGDYAARVVTTDAAGNPSLYGESQTYRLDVTGPASPVFATGPTGTDNVAAVTWTWSFEDVSTGTCTLTHAGVQVGSTVACDSGTYSTTLGAGDGAYVLTVHLTDQYGNSGGTTASAAYTLDLTAPGAPQVTGPSTTSNVTSADYGIVGPVETGATAECRLERDAALVSDWASCTLPTTRALSGDGSWVLKVRLTDQYGNLGPDGASPAYVLDTRPPSVPVVTPPTSPSRNSAPTFTIVMDGDTTAACQLVRGTTVVAVAPSCAGTYTGSLTGLADGDYVLSVASRDAAGNVTTGTSAPYTYDTTPPVAPTVTGPAGPSQVRNPAFSWAAEAGSQAECSVQEKDGTASGWTACSTPHAPTLPSDGTWVLSVRLTDTAGNVSAAGSSGGYLLDTTAPPTPGVVAPASPGRNLEPSWSAVVEAGSRIECRFTGPGRPATDFADCTLPLVTPVTTDGSYTLEVRATDVAGNVSPTGSGTYVLDTTAPGAPVVSQPTGPGRSRAPSLSYSADPGTTGSCRLTRGSMVVSESGPCSSPVQLDLTDLPDGAYTLTVRAVDAAGNTGPAGTATYVLDTTAPATPVFSLVAGSPSADRAPSYAFNAEASAVLACRVTTPAGVVKDLPCTSPLTLDLSGSAEGDYVVAVTARDAAGNTSAAATAGYTLDNSAPSAPRIAGPVTPGSTRTPTWRISSVSQAECRLLRGTSTVKDWFACPPSYTADLYNQPDAVYLLEARVVGTTAQTTSRYRLDTTGPGVATVTAPPSPSTVRKPTWTIASAELAATAECQVTVFGGVLQDWAPCGVSVAGSLFSYDLTGRGDGTYTLHVRLTDNAGNVGATPATSDYVLDTSAPAAVGVVGPASPGNNTKPTWTLNSTSGTKLECRVMSGQTVVKAYAPCAGTFTIDLAAFPDGTYTLGVHALSAAGTPGAETTSDYELDRKADGAPSALTTSEPKISRNRLPVYTFVLPPGSTAVCTVTFKSVTYREGPCTSPYTMDLTNAEDGLYLLSVVAHDGAGNKSSAATAGYTLRTAPAPEPDWTQLPGSPSSTLEPVFGWTTAYDVTSQCRLGRGGVWENNGAWERCTSPYTVNLTGKPDGAYTLQVRVVDVAENPSKPISADYALDRTASPLAVFVATPESPGRDTSPSWTVSAPVPSVEPVTATQPALVRAAVATAAVGAECRFSNRTTGSTGSWTACSGIYTGVTSGDGKYQLEIRPAGSASPVSASTYLLDTRGPEPLALTGPPAAGNEPEVSWSWDDDLLSRVECRFYRTGAAAGAFEACSPPQTKNVQRTGQGAYTFEARVLDRAGNPSQPSLGLHRYDTTPPPAPVFASKPPARGTSGTVTWTFAVPSDASGAATAACAVTHDGRVTDVPCAGSLTLPRLGSPGTWTISVQFTDAAGNTGPATTGTYTLAAALFRDRVDGSGTPGGGPIRPRGDSGGGDEPGVATPANAPFIGPSLGRGPLSAIPRATEVIKKAVRNAAGAISRPPAGIAPDTRVPDAIKNVIGKTITKPQLPLALFVIVVLFLLVQNRIDRRDPKLAAAPVAAEPELEFGPRVRFVATGGATA